MNNKKGQGKVYLVGAGPGDPGLLTVKGQAYIQKADVVIYDRLVNPRLLDKAKAGAELVYAGKGPKGRAMEQVEINSLMVEKAQQGNTVVRLKGGDPFVFGRGGEEAEFLFQHGIPFEVVPGVTSAIAVPAYAGIPLTHRDHASMFTVITGREDPSKADSRISWEALGKGSGTLVVLMGLEALPEVIAKLLKHGMSKNTPVALIERGTDPSQRTVEGDLENILARTRAEALGPPVVAVIGEVVSLREHLKWYDTLPLFGKRILVTRSRHQASALSQLLLEAGAQPVEAPAIQIRPLDDFAHLDKCIGTLSQYHWLVFTSANGVDAFFSRLLQLDMDARALGANKVCAIGSATAATLDARGIRADLVPEVFTSEGVVNAMQKSDVDGKRFLLLRADIGSETLRVGLVNLGAHVDEVTVYRTVQAQRMDSHLKRMLDSGMVDAMTFTSSSTVQSLIRLVDGDIKLLERPIVASIGPVTSRTAREMGLRVDVEAQVHTVPGLVKALIHFYGRDKDGNS